MFVNRLYHLKELLLGILPFHLVHRGVNPLNVIPSIASERSSGFVIERAIDSQSQADVAVNASTAVCVEEIKKEILFSRRPEMLIRYLSEIASLAIYCVLKMWHFAAANTKASLQTYRPHFPGAIATVFETCGAKSVIFVNRKFAAFRTESSRLSACNVGLGVAPISVQTKLAMSAPFHRWIFAIVALIVFLIGSSSASSVFKMTSTNAETRFNRCRAMHAKSTRSMIGAEFVDVSPTRICGFFLKYHQPNVTRG